MSSIPQKWRSCLSTKRQQHKKIAISILSKTPREDIRSSLFALISPVSLCTMMFFHTTRSAPEIPAAECRS